MASTETSGFYLWAARILAGLVALLFCLFVYRVVKRLVIERKPLSPGTTAAGRAQLMTMLNEDGRGAVAELEYQEQDEEREDAAGDPRTPGPDA